MTELTILAGLSNHLVRTAEYTRVTELLDNPDDFESIAQQFIEDLEERLDELDLDDTVLVIAVERLTDDLTREELDYRLTIIVSPTDYYKLDQGGMI